MFGLGNTRKSGTDRAEESAPSPLVARQPIVDADSNIVAFELLYRGGPFDQNDSYASSRATAQVMAQNLLALDVASLTSGRPAYVNFPASMLLADYAQVYDPDLLVVEVLEHVEPTGDILRACRRLRRAGFRVALDDVTEVDRVRAFAGCVDVVKVDLSAVPDCGLRPMVVEVRSLVPDVTLLAEKVETQHQFDAAVAAGFRLFQGYVLGRPQTVKRTMFRGFEPLYLELLEATAAAEPDFRAIEEIVKRDMALTDRVLRLANSPLHRRLFAPRTLSEALLRLGAGELRRVAALMVLAGMAEQRPSHLLADAVTRARLCESLARPDKDEGTFNYFLAGMFSLSPAILGIRTEEAVALLPLPDEVKAAIVDRRGRLGRVLDLTELYEQAEWAPFETLATELGIALEALADRYREAVRWGSETLELSAA